MNPSDGSALSLVVLTNKPEYLESRAVEMIHDAQRVSEDKSAYEDLMSKAMTLLACATVKRGSDER